MKIVQTHQTIVNHDAIGNDIEVIHKILSQKHDCKVYAQFCLNKHVNYIEKQDFYNLIEDPDTLIIYHHSGFWEEGYEFLKNAKSKIVIRYHNITPPEFFAPYNEHHHSQCKFGREQTKCFARDFPDAFWLPDSEYNALDAEGISAERLAILPPFNKIEEWAKGLPDEALLSGLLNSLDVNLLFVGRIAPNKGHLFLLDILNAYQINYNDKIKLRIIGKFDDGLSGYNELLEQKINDYGLKENVEFVGEINDALLSSYYLGSDFFICASEHEGFCVPVPEAQFFGLPIIAKATSAIPETMGLNQLILKDNPLEYAAAIHLIYKNREYYNFLRKNGIANFQSRFSMDKLTNHFSYILKHCLGVTL
jgi:glycosyltransferase involved in cell wall biosynthesis